MERLVGPVSCSLLHGRVARLHFPPSMSGKDFRREKIIRNQTHRALLTYLQVLAQCKKQRFSVAANIRALYVTTAPRHALLSPVAYCWLALQLECRLALTLVCGARLCSSACLPTIWGLGANSVAYHVTCRAQCYPFAVTFTSRLLTCQRSDK